MKQATSPKTDGINTQLNLDMSPAELLEHLEAKHGPLTEEELKEVRRFLMELMNGRYNDLGLGKDLDQVGLEKRLLEVEILSKFHETLRSKLPGAQCMINYDPRELLITNLIFDFIISHKFNYELRTLEVGERSNLGLWQGMGVMDDIDRALEIIRENMAQENWLQNAKDEMWHQYPPVSNQDLEFMMQYLRKMAEKNPEKKSGAGNTRKKVGDILGKKK